MINKDTFTSTIECDINNKFAKFLKQDKLKLNKRRNLSILEEANKNNNEFEEKRMKLRSHNI